jgi:biofilm PGA synthesis N-glycosyltransferase PgaC
MKPAYVVVTPVRNEEQFLNPMMESVVSQTVRPSVWVVVNDGSTDGTLGIVAKFANRHRWIRVVENPAREGYELGGGVIKAFYKGLEALQCDAWDYLVKLDGDLVLPSHYFEVLLQRFQDNQQLGMACGRIFMKQGEDVSWDLCSKDHVRGALKMYRRKCWNDIGGLRPRRLWDIIDEMQAQQNGWKTQSFPDLPVLHQRRTDGRQAKPLESKFILGKNFYNIGYHPLFTLVKSLKMSLYEHPRLTGGVAMLAGYMAAMVRREPIFDVELAYFIRFKQMERCNIRHFIEYFSLQDKK